MLIGKKNPNEKWQDFLKKTAYEKFCWAVPTIATNKQTAIPTEEILPKLGSPLTGMDVEVKPQWSYLLIFLGVCSVISLSFL